MEISLFNAVLLDVLVWMACVIALLAFAKLSVTHPATTYLAFHALLFSARAIAILNGAAALFSGPTTTSVTEAEISRALLLADFGLAAMTCGWILAAYAQTTLVREPRGLRLGIIRVVSTIAIPLGCVAILLWSKLPFLGQAEISGPWATSNWIVIAQTWAGLSLLVLIYWYGFKPVLTIPMALYLAFVIYQGAFRFRLLVPVILLIQIYLDRRGRRWPTLSSAIMLLACGLLFFPLKEIGQQLQSGDSIENVWQNASEEITNAFRGVRRRHGCDYVGRVLSELLLRRRSTSFVRDCISKRTMVQSRV